MVGHLSDEDKIQILAFAKWLRCGKSIIVDGVRKLKINKLEHDYATGKISAKTFLLGDSEAKTEDLDELWREYGLPELENQHS